MTEKIELVLACLKTVCSFEGSVWEFVVDDMAPGNGPNISNLI